MNEFYSPDEWSKDDHKNIAAALKQIGKNTNRINWKETDSLPAPKGSLLTFNASISKVASDNHAARIARVVMAHLKKQWEAQRNAPGGPGHSLTPADKQQYSGKKIHSPLTGRDVEVSTLIGEYEKYQKSDPQKASKLKPMIERMEGHQKKRFESRGHNTETGERSPSHTKAPYSHTLSHRDLSFEFGSGPHPGMGHSPDFHENITGNKLDWQNKHRPGWHDQKHREMYSLPHPGQPYHENETAKLPRPPQKSIKAPQHSVGDIARQYMKKLQDQGVHHIQPSQKVAARYLLSSKVAQRHLEAGSDGNYMSVQNIKDIHSMSGDLMLHIHQGDELEDWVDDKISSARQEVSDVHRFYDSGQGDLKTLSSRLATRYLGPLGYDD